MTLTQLRYFISIIDAGLNVTLAAERVNATQPGLSKQLRQLEDELGFRLFHRRGRSLSAISTGGAKVAEHARALLAEAAQIRAFAGAHRGDRAGAFRIAATPTEARYVLPITLAHLRAVHPGLVVHILSCDVQEAAAKVERGEADAALVGGVCRSLGGALSLPAYRWNLVGLSRINGAPRGGDLSGLPLVTYDAVRRSEGAMQEAWEAAAAGSQLACTTGDDEVIKTCVRAGLGVGLLAEMALQGSDDLELFTLSVAAAPMTASIVLPRDGLPSDLLLDWLSDFAPQLGRRGLRSVLGGNVGLWPEPPAWKDLMARLAPDAPAFPKPRRVVPFAPSAGPFRRTGTS